MGDEMLYPPFFSFVYGPEFTNLCFFSHQCNASESTFKENLGIQDILIHQKASNFVNTNMQQVLMCGIIWRHYNDDFISNDLIGQKYLTDCNVRTVNAKNCQEHIERNSPCLQNHVKKFNNLLTLDEYSGHNWTNKGIASFNSRFVLDQTKALGQNCALMVLTLKYCTTEWLNGRPRAYVPRADRYSQ